MKKPVKITLYVVGGLLALTVIALTVVVMYLDTIIQKGVTVFGSKMTGTKIELKSVSLSLFQPKLELKGFIVGNPAGYSSPEAMSLKRLYIEVDRNSLFTNRILINRIVVDGANICFEPKITGENNLSDLKKNIDKQVPKSEPAKPETAKTPEPAEKKPGKTVVIKLFELTNAKISVSSSLIRGNSISLPLVDFSMKDIGEKKSSSIEEAFSEIYDGIFKGVYQAVAKAPDAIPLNKIQETGKEVIDKAGQEGGKLIKDIKNLF